MFKNVNKNVDSKNDCILIVNSPDFVGCFFCYWDSGWYGVR